MNRFYDISVSISKEFPVWPGAQEFELEQKQTVLSDGEAKLDWCG